MMEGVPLRSPQGRDERLNGSVADAIAARDEEVRELWSMVQQKDADLRSAAELGKMLLDEKEEDAEAHEGEKEALWRRIQEMARRVMELEEEAAELRELAAQHQPHPHHHQQQSHANGDTASAGADPIALASPSLGSFPGSDGARPELPTNSKQDSYEEVSASRPVGGINSADDSGVGGLGIGGARWKGPGVAGRESLAGGWRAEERALRAKNEMLERQLGHMKEALEEAQLELEVERKARFARRSRRRGSNRPSSLSSQTTTATASTTLVRSRDSSYGNQVPLTPTKIAAERRAGSPTSSRASCSRDDKGGSHSGSKDGVHHHRRARSSSGRVQSDLASWFASPLVTRPGLPAGGQVELDDEDDEEEEEEEEESEVSEEALRNADRIHGSPWRDDGSVTGRRLGGRGEGGDYDPAGTDDQETEESISGDVKGAVEGQADESDEAWFVKQNSWLLEQLESKDELIEALRAQLEEAGRYGKRAGAGAPGQDMNRSGVPSSFFDGGMESSDEDSDDNADRGLGIRERSFLDDLLAGGSLGGVGMGEAVFLPNSRNYSGSTDGPEPAGPSRDPPGSMKVDAPEAGGVSAAAVEDKSERQHGEVEPPVESGDSLLSNGEALVEKTSSLPEKPKVGGEVSASPSTLPEVLSNDIVEVNAGGIVAKGRVEAEPEGESRADDSPEDSLVKETVAAEFDVPEALEFAEKTEAVVVDDEDRMGTDAGAAPALVEDEEPQREEAVGKDVVMEMGEVLLPAEPVAIEQVSRGTRQHGEEQVEEYLVAESTAPEIVMAAPPVLTPPEASGYPVEEEPQGMPNSGVMRAEVVAGPGQAANYGVAGAVSQPMSVSPVEASHAQGVGRSRRASEPHRAARHRRQQQQQQSRPRQHIPLSMNRAERKSRQAMDKLGLRAVRDIFRMTLKASNGVVFAIKDPDVFKHPRQNTYVVFGVAETESSTYSGSGTSGSSYNQRPPSYSSVPSRRASAPPLPQEVYGAAQTRPSPSLLAPSQRPDPDALESKSVSAGVDPADVMTIVSHVGCDLDTAILALKEADGDIVNAVMSLTSMQ